MFHCFNIGCQICTYISHRIYFLAIVFIPRLLASVEYCMLINPDSFITPVHIYHISGQTYASRYLGRKPVLLLVLEVSPWYPQLSHEIFWRVPFGLGLVPFQERPRSLMRVCVDPLQSHPHHVREMSEDRESIAFDHIPVPTRFRFKLIVRINQQPSVPVGLRAPSALTK